MTLYGVAELGWNIPSARGEIMGLLFYCASPPELSIRPVLGDDASEGAVEYFSEVSGRFLWVIQFTSWSRQAAGIKPDIDIK